MVRLCVFRSNNHIYAQVISAEGDKVLAQASTLEAEVRSSLKSGSNVEAAAVVGKRIAEKAKQWVLKSCFLTVQVSNITVV